MAEPKPATGANPTVSATQQFATGGDAPLDAVGRADAAQVQFPSLVGQSGVEVAERSADVSKASTKQHRKVFRVFTAGLDFDAASFDHLPNFTATRQYMLDHGLRPVGDVAFVGAEKYDEKNTDLIYQVEALPAAIATAEDHPDQAHVTVPQDAPAR